MKPGDFTKYAQSDFRELMMLSGIGTGVPSFLRNLGRGARGLERAGPGKGSFMAGAGLSLLPFADDLRNVGLRGPEDLVGLGALTGMGGTTGLASGWAGSHAGHAMGRGSRALGQKMGLVAQDVAPELVEEAIADPTFREQAMSYLKSLYEKYPDEMIIGGSALGGVGLGKALSD